MGASVVNDFTTYRRINVLNSQKPDSRSHQQEYARFGNTVLLELQQSTTRPLFKSLRILVNRLHYESLHKFIGLTFSEGEYRLSYREFTKTSLTAFLNQHPDQAKNPHSIVHRIFDSCDHYSLRSFQQLQQILNEKKFYPPQLGELMTFEDYISMLLLLTTPYVRSKLSEVYFQEYQQVPSEVVQQYYQWFYSGETREDQPIQQRALTLQKMVENITKQLDPTIQSRHPSLLDFKPSSKQLDLSPLKRVIPTHPKDLPVLDRFVLAGEITPTDLLQEAEIQLEANQRGGVEADKCKEIERLLRLEYQAIEQNKKKRVALYVGPSPIHKYGLFSKQK